MPFFSSMPPFIWSANDQGIAVRFSDLRRYKKAQKGHAGTADQLAFIRMQMLAECGQAEVREVEGGIFISTPDAVRLDKDSRESFFLPSHWPGGLRLQTESVPQLPGFQTRIGLVDPGGSALWNWRLRGPILEAGGESYLPTAPQFAALQTYTQWRETKERDELTNLSLIATLREAWNEGCRIYLETYRDTIIANADDLSLDAREDKDSGDWILRPMVSGDFPDLDPDKIEERISQLRIGSDRAVLRVGKTIVLLNPEQTRIARAVAARGRVPRNQRTSFEKNPSAWLAENVFPDVETEFSPRVTGIGVWKGGYLGAKWEAGEDWFGKHPEPEKTGLKDAAGHQEREDEPDSLLPEDDETPKQIVPLIIPNDEELGFGWRFPELDSENAEPFKPDLTRYARKPLLHQEDGVRWLLGHARRALQRLNPDEKPGGFGAGALLADDMGLGKTFTTLMLIAEWFRIWRKITGKEPPAVLIVAPLSLLENWKEEIKKSFKADDPVFTRVLIAQTDAELDKIRRSPGIRDVAIPGQVTQYGLGFGDGTERSADYPGGCVLTTYQTLRDYRFSFAKAEWSAAVFDEAQYIKNPNALQTIAAKSLKAIFRIALTGTPVENHLGDFWCILDTAEPGPLGAFADFRRKWILPIARERNRMAEIGKELREHVGGLMLRRMKEEHLKGLPSKTVEQILVDMTREQTDLYDTVIAAAHSDENPGEKNEKQRQNYQLAALWQIRQVSLHPDLLGGGNIPVAKDSDTSRAVLSRSGKLAWLLNRLDQIKELGEKALIFCVQKKLQEGLAYHLSQIYGRSVPVINGDTKATSKRKKESTRLGLIEKFSNQSGFGICILSPIAAGAGLNIVAANHVIHLERHWNPAKEDQATDRAYRIGQDRPVIVCLPIGIHPKQDSFDLILHRLLEKKRAIQDALGIVPPEAVTGPEIIRAVFGAADYREKQTDSIVDLKSALKLSWRLFEALIAAIYKQEAQRVILTPGTSDHGCDVVVLGWGENLENLLIQCKMTIRDTLDSEKAVREIEGARPFYEKALGVTFNRRCLHTTAKKCSRRTLNAAKLCGIAFYGRSWLSDMLGRMQIRPSDILSLDARREKAD